MKRFVPLHFSNNLKNKLTVTLQTGALVMLILFCFNSTLKAEGTVDLKDNPGFRLFYWANEQQQIKVYANAGEFINVGASHVGLNGGVIVLFKPDGSVANVFDNSGPNAGLGIINNDIEESNGPTGGGTTSGNGYIPGIQEVMPGEEGVWTVFISFPNPSNAVPFTNVLNNASWDRATHQINSWCVAAWDVTVSQNNAGNNGGALLEGRVYTNNYKGIVYENGNTVSPRFYVLSKDGFQYQIDFNHADPYEFDIFSNSMGLVDYLQQPAYSSVETADYAMSSSPASWVPGGLYLFDPQTSDFGSMVNHKMFFNIPDPNMPDTAPTTNVFNGQSSTTWLYNEPAANPLEVNNFDFTAIDDFGGMNCYASNMTSGFGGNLSFNSTVGGTVKFSLDLNSDGDFEDAVDRVLFGNISVGNNSIFWDGLNGTGSNLPLASNMQINYQIEVIGGEVHIMLKDVENNSGGVTFTRLNGNNVPDNNFYYNHNEIGGPVSGGASPNITSTTIPYQYISNFGDNNLLDFWANTTIPGTENGFFTVDVVTSCTTPTVRDSDADGIYDDEDLDDDNDGIPDSKEFCSPDANWACLPGGLDPSGDNDADGVPNFLDSNDPAVNSGCLDNNGNGVCDIIAPIYDNDLDGVPDHLDLDSDNDGVLDMTEAGHNLVDTDQDGRIDGTQADFGDNGLFNVISDHPDAFNASITYGILNTDSDNFPDHDDLDADADGLMDAMEAPVVDADFDGIVGTGVPTVDENGLVVTDGNGNPITVKFVPNDLDNDNLPDFRDWDRDGDGIPDGYECPNPMDCLDSDNDGNPDMDETDSDGDGLLDADECSAGIPCPDLNNNGVDDYRESQCGTGNIPVITGLVGEGSYCEGTGVTLSASNAISMPGATIDYTWTGPNGFSFTGTTGGNGPFTAVINSLTSLEAGTYELTLMTDQGCGSNTSTVEVTVGTSPDIPTLTVNDNVLCEGEMLELSTDQVIGTNVVYEWFFKNNSGTFSLGQTGTPLFVNTLTSVASTGTYCVQVYKDGCTSQLSNPEIVTVNSTSTPVAVNTSTLGVPACVGEAVQLSVPLVLDATYEWFGPNGFNSTQHDPVLSNITPTDAGNYYVVVTMSGGCANLVSTTTTVFVQDTPAAAAVQQVDPVCEGSDISLVANPIGVPTGTMVNYEWFYAPTGSSFGQNSSAELNLTNVSAAEAGDYYVIMTVGNCVASPSEMVNVEIVQNSEMPNAGTDMTTCGLGNVLLSAMQPTIGIGTWTSPTGATITDENNALSTATDLTVGMNMFVWSLSNGICENYASDTVIINFTTVAVDVASAGIDVNVCDDNTATLNANVPSSAFGIWSQPATQIGVNISNNTSPTPTVTGLIPGNTYVFTYTLSDGSCLNYDSDEVLVNVSEIPSTLAHINENVKYACGNNEITLSAVQPSSATGTWTTTSNATIISSNNASTIVDDIPMGNSMFIWSLSSGACVDYDSDTVMVVNEQSVEVTDDTYLVTLNGRLENKDLLVNDFIGNVNDWEVNIVTQPSLGTVEMSDGIFTYTPERNAFGTDEWIYEICNVNCPTACEEGTVKIELNGLTETGDCWVPNVLTPDGNGKNDVLLIPCTEVNDENELVIFNRRGDKVYEATNYQNDWAATYKGKDLPAGTYYYIFKLNPNDAVAKQGFFEIVR